ncbi:hypothetical protein BBP13_12125 [Limosilactobacillus reuteri]|nr:hypothetical protein BBP13_12125 [Limosilactobacillus reuteri]
MVKNKTTVFFSPQTLLQTPKRKLPQKKGGEGRGGGGGWTPRGGRLVHKKKKKHTRGEKNGPCPYFFIFVAQKNPHPNTPPTGKIIT